MEETLPPVVNIEASLVNVQRGDVMVIRMPENLHWEERHRVAKVIRDVLRTQSIDIPVLTLPYKWDIMMVEKGEAWKFNQDEHPCWWCKQYDTDAFDTEFDTYLHINCLKEVLEKDPDHPEAIHMKYLLEEDEK
jgi:hypothetical protein